MLKYLNTDYKKKEEEEIQAFIVYIGIFTLKTKKNQLFFKVSR